jgi:hypothetical protein
VYSLYIRISYIYIDRSTAPPIDIYIKHNAQALHTLDRSQSEILNHASIVLEIDGPHRSTAIIFATRTRVQLLAAHCQEPRVYVAPTFIHISKNMQTRSERDFFLKKARLDPSSMWPRQAARSFLLFSPREYGFQEEKDCSFS